ETGKVFFNQESPELGTVPDQPDVFSFVAVGSSGPGDVAGLGRPVDVFRGMALWRSIVDQMGLGSSEIRQAELPGLHPGRGARVVLDGASIGQIGELHPAVARAFDLTGRVLVGELDLNPLVADPGLLSFVEPSVFPPSEFDLSFDVGLTTPAAALLSEASNAGGDLVESVEVFDEFLRGDAKAIGLRVTIRASDRTLTADDVADVRTRVIRAVTDKTGAKLRGG
ncbi:MAG: hypothetical protein OEY55_08115, partial [Acidimicrobiia bacterium]|nr:hypothetical protein [Acidimicrobiia bacterium]